jgi:hypothetical protein
VTVSPRATSSRPRSTPSAASADSSGAISAHQPTARAPVFFSDQPVVVHPLEPLGHRLLVDANPVGLGHVFVDVAGGQERRVSRLECEEDGLVGQFRPEPAAVVSGLAFAHTAT